MYLRELIQNNTKESDMTALDISRSLKRSRMEIGGLSLQEVSDIIIESLEPEEVDVIVSNLQRFLDNYEK